jgi:predicted nucleic acid-binding protein
MFATDFAGRILPFEAGATARYPEIIVARRRAGQPIEGLDALIAAIALANGAGLATPDAGGFEGCGLTLIDPWAAA